MLFSPDNSGIHNAANALKFGELVAFPTDTFFALGADGLSAAAVGDVFAIKGRNPGTPVPLLLDDFAMVDPLVTEFPSPLRKLAERFWPGVLTIVLPASKSVPEVVTAGTGTVGVRVPNHDLVRELICVSGVPLTGTSCNLTGRPPIKEAIFAEQVFGSNIAGCIDAPCGTSDEPSTVVSYADGEVVVLRNGAISVESMRNIVDDIVVS
ncbi:MAG: threonylcarbamoyl-AMP synthase [Chloroflexi bacterium]|nr:threonylcarbamoyl-AMP synthase [Chloroflexota bacterium]|tara:strand:- start:4764 stop:5390 length:627 start_codon:yes stop_codon:yes gene_type:complete